MAVKMVCLCVHGSYDCGHLHSSGLMSVTDHTHGLQRGLRNAGHLCLSVCLSVFPHYKSESVEVMDTKLGTPDYLQAPWYPKGQRSEVKVTWQESV